MITVQQHLVEMERESPGSSGDFTGLMWDFILAAKQISREINRAGLAEILGSARKTNIQGEEVQKLDEYANEHLINALSFGGHLCAMGSEENDDIIPIPDDASLGKYVMIFDPLDGSSNIDVNVSVGTIFSIYRRTTKNGPGTLEDFLRKGSEQVAAGYVLYGSSTMMVYTTGNGVDGFTLDPSIGEFLLSHPHIRIPTRGAVYSNNDVYTPYLDQGSQAYLAHLRERMDSGKLRSQRHIGSLVADVHRNLLRGGIHVRPADSSSGELKPKLRLLYEAAPFAMICEQAGGAATTGDQRILDIRAESLHQRVPLIIGSKDDVEDYERFFKEQNNVS